MEESKPKKKKKIFEIVVNKERCKACGLCMEACPKNVFEKGDEINAKGYQAVIATRPQDCIGCRACILVCPDVVFELYELSESA